MDQETIDPRGQAVMNALRTEYPDLGDVSDDDLLQAVHETVYPDLPEEDFTQALRDVYAKDIPEPPEPPKPSVGNVLKGIGKAVWEDLSALPRAAYQFGEAAATVDTAPQEALQKLDEVQKNARKGSIVLASMIPGFKSLALTGAVSGAIYGSLTALNEGRASDMLKEGTIGAGLGAVLAPAVGAVTKGGARLLRGKPVPVPEPSPVKPPAAPRPGYKPTAPESMVGKIAAARDVNELGLQGPSPGVPARATPREAMIDELSRPYQPSQGLRRPMTQPTGPGWDTVPGRASHAEILADKPVPQLADAMPNLFDDVAAGTLTPEQATAQVLDNTGAIETADPGSIQKLYYAFQHHAEATWEDIHLEKPPLRPMEPTQVTPQPTNPATQVLEQERPVGSPVLVHNEPYNVAGYSESGKLQVITPMGRVFEALPSDVVTQRTGFNAWLETLESDARRRIASRGVAMFSNPVNQLADMALLEAVGAARLFRTGVRNMAQWSDDMVREFGSTIEPHLQELWTRSQRFLRNRILKSEEDLVDTRSFLEAFHQGKPGMTWYDDTWRELQGLVGEDADMLARFLAATSAGRSSESNVTLALRAYGNWKLGQDVAQGQIRSHRMQLLRAVRNETFGDLKVQNFYRALKGDKDAVVIDRWMSQVLGFKNDALKPEQYRFATEVIKDLARDADVTPRQFQAALWAAARGERALTLSKMGYQAKFSSFKPLEEILKNKLQGRTVADYAESLLPKVAETYRSHWVNADKGINMALTTGGHTFSFHTMGSYQGSGYLTTVYNRVYPKNEVTPQQIMQLRNEVWDLAKKYENQGQFTLGLWTQGEEMHVDFNMVLPTEAKALAVGRNMDQYMIGRMKKGSYEGDIPTGKPQDEPQRRLTLEEADAAIQSALGKE